MRTRAVFVALLALALAGGIALLLWYRAPDTPGPGAARAPEIAARNVLLITIDTLRADAVGAYGGRTARTPAMDRLASEGMLFERASAVAPITLTSHATLLTGLYPPGHGARHNGIGMGAGVPTLAERFRDAGGGTAAFVSAFPLDRSFGLDRGFEIYSDRMPRGADGRLRNERPGREAVDEAIAWIAGRRDARFFAWVHLFEPHAPYGDASDGRPVAARYADEVEEADAQVGRLLDAIAPLRSETLVLLAADHGEAFGEHGEIAHSIFVYDTTLRVPLILAGPGVSAGVRARRPVSLADVAPTAARLAGLRGWDGDGADLITAGVPAAGAPPRVLYAESFAPLLDFGWSSLRTLRREPWKYIAAPEPELYNLETDPGETRNVAPAHAAIARELRERLETFSGPELASAAPVDADPEARRRLQALGYASGSRARPAGERRDPKDARGLAAQLALIASGELHGNALERALEAVLSQDTHNPQAAVRLGYIRMENGRCADAEALFGRAIDAQMPGSDAYLGLATCQGRRGAVRDALASLEQARAREPHNAVVLANIGIARERLGETAGAEEALRAAVGRDPDLHEARFHLALLLARAGNREEARREAETLLARLPGQAPQRAEVLRLLSALR